MRKITLAIAGAAVALASIGSAVAGPENGRGQGGGGKPGGGTMPGASAFGLCKAYFAGSPTGQANKRKAPPFQDLAAKAEAADQTVEQFCAAQTPGGRG